MNDKLKPSLIFPTVCSTSNFLFIKTAHRLLYERLKAIADAAAKEVAEVTDYIQCCQPMLEAIKGNWRIADRALALRGLGLKRGLTADTRGLLLPRLTGGTAELMMWVRGHGENGRGQRTA